MAKKKKRKFDGFVYSTDPDFNYEDNLNDENTRPPHQQNLRIHLRRMKGNKQATIVREFIGAEDDLQALGKLLKQKCGTGGAVKDGEIIIQGDKRKQVGDILTQEGYKWKFSGG